MIEGRGPPERENVCPSPIDQTHKDAEYADYASYLLKADC
jgi:hypothetical protein